MEISRKMYYYHNLIIKIFFFRELRWIHLTCLGLFLINLANAQTSRLFESDKILELTLKCDLKSLLKDRGDDPSYHKSTLHYQDSQSSWNIPVRIRSRGHFRKMSSKCKFPPLYLNFAKSTTPESSLFFGQDKIKLVTPCQGDQYVIHEYLVYQLYNLITPKSFNARLVTIVFEDTVKNKSSDPYYGILLEEEDQMARRNNSELIEMERLRPESTRKEDFLQMAVFQYLIGNTDWSIQYLQNIKLIMDDASSLPVTVPYDFDHAGIVRAPYADPAPELEMSSILERRYRGHCINDMDQFIPVFKKFNQLREKFNSIYVDNSLISDNYKNQTLKFLDQFYETINDPERAEQEFTYPCNKSGTGNIVIKGLDKD